MASKNSLASYRRVLPEVGEKYSYAKPETHPEGLYDAIIDKVEKTTSNAGNPSLDVFYRLRDQGGKVRRAKQRIAKDTPFMDNFVSAIERAGVDVGNVDPEDISGVNLDLELDYNEDGYAQFTFLVPGVGSTCKTKKASSMGQLLNDDDDEVELEEEDR